jgi:hypothetical protein
VKKGNKIVERRRIPFEELSRITLSECADNFIVVHGT